MGIANQQILSHLSIDDIPKSMLTNGGGSISDQHHETQMEINQTHQSNGNIDYYTSPTREGGGGEVNERNGKPWHSINIPIAYLSASRNMIIYFYDIITLFLYFCINNNSSSNKCAYVISIFFFLPTKVLSRN